MTAMINAAIFFCGAFLGVIVGIVIATVIDDARSVDDDWPKGGWGV